MAERVDVNVNLTGLTEATAEWGTISREVSTAATGFERSSRAARSFAASSKRAADEQAGFFAAGKDRVRASRAASFFRGGAMLGVMGIEAGMGLLERAGGGGETVRGLTSTISGAALGAQAGAMLGPAGAAIGGVTGGVLSGINAMFDSVMAGEKRLAEYRAQVAAEEEATAKKRLEQTRALADVWQVAGGVFTGVGMSIKDVAIQTEDAAAAAGIEQSVVDAYVGALVDQAANVSTVIGAVDTANVKNMANLMRTYNLSTDQLARMTIAAEESGLSLSTYTKLLADQGREAVRSGRATSVSGYMGGVIGSMDRGEGRRAVLAGAIFGSDFATMTDAFSSGRATDDQLRARAAIGITAGMSPEEQRARAASVAMAGGDLKGTGLEGFREILIKFGATGPLLDIMGINAQKLNEAQTAGVGTLGLFSKAVEGLTANLTTLNGVISGISEGNLAGGGAPPALAMNPTQDGM